MILSKKSFIFFYMETKFCFVFKLNSPIIFIIKYKMHAIFERMDKSYQILKKITLSM